MRQGGRQFTDSCRKPAVGCHYGKHVKVVCAFDPEMFAAVRKRAVAGKTSMAEQIRLLVEWGMEA